MYNYVVKTLVSYIYIGPPIKRMQTSYGTASRIQLNDSFASVDEIQEFIASEQEARDEKEIPYIHNFSLNSCELSFQRGFLLPLEYA